MATIKHAHHSFDLDLPGKDSYEQRKAGAGEVIISSSRRVAQIRELREGEGEPDISTLLERLSANDLVLVEGYKASALAKAGSLAHGGGSSAVGAG